MCGKGTKGNGKCETACGADPLCDEKGAYKSCGSNGICTDFCECCEPNDSDNGKDYFKKGTTRGLEIAWFQYYKCSTKTDYCINSTHLVEYYLDSYYIKNETFNCKSLGNYDCFDGVCFSVSVTLTLSKYTALPNEQITAKITINGFTSSMQGKTAYVLKADISTINSCVSNCIKYGGDAASCFNSCINAYITCNCTIDSTGSCSCNFNVPSNSGTYNYTGFVDLNSNNAIESGEYDTKSLTVSLCYKTCNTHNDCKGDFEKNCCQNGLAAYCNPETKTCECFPYCTANDECQEGYCCLYSIDSKLPMECVPSWNITNYQGKSYLCDPIIWKNEENLKNENNKNLIEVIIEKIRSLLQPLSTFISHFK
ncbi:MAG: hypothetical protein LM601_11435 [Candidatus Verstraetearchaeota archaeon]|nr:hypothetical protein [Candidatus Verstraetearchaeota archaeon]